MKISPQVTGKCGSVEVRLIPAPRGTGIVSAPVPKKLLTLAGIEDCYTRASGSTRYSTLHSALTHSNNRGAASSNNFNLSSLGK